MLNVVALNGRLTVQPELKYTPSNIGVCTFNIAVERNLKSKDGEKNTDFINIVAWRQTAEFVSRFFKKGQMIAIQGELQSRKFTDKCGVNHTVYEVNAQQVSFCGGDGKPAQAEPQEQSQAELEDVTVTDEDLPF